MEASVAPHTIELSAATPMSDTSATASSRGRLENMSPSLSRNTLSASTPKTRHSEHRIEHKMLHHQNFVSSLACVIESGRCSRCMQLWCNVCCGAVLSFATVADVGCATLVGQKWGGTPDAEVGKVCVDAYACFKYTAGCWIRIDSWFQCIHSQCTRLPVEH